MRRRSNRPPPADGAPAPRRRLPWRRGGGPTAGLRPGTDAAYESSDAAEQERLITEALGDLRDMDVREVMTPRLDVVALSIPVHTDDVVQAVRESGHSCFPVVNGTLDDVLGVLYVNDLFRTRRAGRGGLFSGASSPSAAIGAEGPAPRASAPMDPTLQATAAPRGASPRRAPTARDDPAEPGGLSPIDISRRIRPPYVIPESRRILAALVEMRRHRRGFAVVVDEYGGVSGVLTVKDLLEPIVGDLHDELDRVDEEPSILRVDASRWLIDGRTNVDEVRDSLGIDVPEGDYVTIAGYLVDGLGHIPVVGESQRTGEWELTVQEMDKRRIAMVVARRLEAAESTPPSPPSEARGTAELSTATGTVAVTASEAPQRARPADRVGQGARSAGPHPTGTPPALG